MYRKGINIGAVWPSPLGCLLVCGIGLFCFSSVTEAQEVVQISAPTGLTGSTQVATGTEIQIYSVGLNDGNALPLTGQPNLGQTVSPNGGIQITISDLTAPTGLVAADIAELRLYRSGDAIFDGGDLQMLNSVAANIGAVTELDVSAQGFGIGTNREIPTAGGRFFIVTAVIAAGATSGHTFRVGAAANHIGIHEPLPFGADNYTFGAPIVAADGNHIIIAAQSPSFTSGVAGGGRGIPFGGEPVILIVLLGSGLYMIRRASR